MTLNLKPAQRLVRLLARLRERIEVRETGMASFISRDGIIAMLVEPNFLPASGCKPFLESG